MIELPEVMPAAVYQRPGQVTVEARPVPVPAPGEVLLAGLGEQVVAGVFQAAGEVEPGRVLGDQGPVPGPLPLGGLVPGGVESQGGGAEVA